MILLLKILLVAPILCFLPGFATLMVLHRPRNPLMADELVNSWDILFQILLFSVSLTSSVGLVLLHLGRFRLFSLMACNTVYSAILILWFWLRKDLYCFRLPPIPRNSLGIVLLFLGLAGGLFLHPHEFLVGGADAGVYVNLGQTIARTGAWLIHDPEIATLDESLYPALFREQSSYALTDYIQFPGFYLADPSSGLVIPQFYPLHPLWIAIFSALGGLRFSLFATPFWGALGVLSVYFAMRHILNKRVGLMAAFFLMITATQVWFSRYPTAEVLTQFLLFGGLYALSLYVLSPSTWNGLLAALALALTTLVRVDMYVLIAIPLAYALWLRLNRQLRLHHLAFFLPFILVVAYSVYWGLSQSWPYFLSVYGLELTSLSLPVLIVLAVLVVVGFIGLDWWVGRNDGWGEMLRPAFTMSARLIAVIVVLAAFYGYFIRPYVGNTEASMYYWYSNSEIFSVEPYNLVRLGWYLSPLGILLAVIGTWRLLTRNLKVSTVLFLAIGLFFSFFYLQNARNNPHHIYVMRRYVPVVIPFFCVTAAYALDGGILRAKISLDKVLKAVWKITFEARHSTIVDKHRVMHALSLVAACILSGWLLYNARVVIPNVEYRGALQQFKTFVEILGDSEGTLILFNDDLPVSTGAVVGTPLHYIYGYTVFDIQESYVKSDAFFEQIKRWQVVGWRILVVDGLHHRDDLIDDAVLTPVAEFEFNMPVLEASYEHFPRRIMRHIVPLKVYEMRKLN